MFIFFVNNIPKGAGEGGAQQLRVFTVLQRARFYFLNAGSGSQLSVNPVPENCILSSGLSGCLQISAHRGRHICAKTHK